MPIEIRSDGDSEKGKEIVKEAAYQAATEVSDRDSRIKSILAQVEAEFIRGRSVKITQDMRDLGIDGKVTELAFMHSYRRKLMKSAGVFEDEESPKSPIEATLRSSLG